ncbi:MAG: hypothetical protein PHI98_16605 [Eubacteriales bacterium]|nr:hypothetical protein [Eubacteriales bacterium]
MKALSVLVYRSAAIGDCTNGGISSRFKELLVECEEGYINVDPANPPENLVRLAYRRIGGRDVYHLEPTAKATGVGWMMGGNYAATSDSRFGEMTGIYGAIAIHDRTESQELYDLMSR